MRKNRKADTSSSDIKDNSVKMFVSDSECLNAYLLMQTIAKRHPV